MQPLSSRASPPLNEDRHFSTAQNLINKGWNGQDLSQFVRKSQYNISYLTGYEITVPETEFSKIQVAARKILLEKQKLERPVPPSPTSLVSSPLPDLIKKESCAPSEPNTVEAAASENLVTQQLSTLIEMCDHLIKQPESIQTLFDISWGVGSIPKEKKFSKKWKTIVSERTWLLLEDASRQITSGYPDYPNVNQSHKKKIKELTSQFSKAAANLKIVFLTLLEMEKSNKSSSAQDAELKPNTLPIIEKLFARNFDSFILEQVSRNIEMVKASLQNQEPIEWLKNPIHIKAFFRSIEVLGEASKLLSDNAKKMLPILTVSSINKDSSSSTLKDKPLWGKIRNQLHHNKKRCWDIARFAPEKWAILLKDFFPKMEAEISLYKIRLQGTDTSLLHPPSQTENLENQTQLSFQYIDSNVIKIWEEVKNDFIIIPPNLQRIIFGYEIPPDNFLQTWETLAKPHLKSYVDGGETRDLILEIFRIQRDRYRNVLENLSHLCSQEQFREVGKIWQEVENNFVNPPAMLKRVLFGFEPLPDNFLESWETYAKPFLNPIADPNINCILFLEMLRIGNENLIQETDIENLYPSIKPLDKKAAIAKMKELLNSLLPHSAEQKEQNKLFSKSYNQLANQFVFLKREKFKSKAQQKASSEDCKEIFLCDREKNETLKKLLLQRLNQVNAFQFGEATFREKDGTLTEYGLLLEAFITLKHHRLNQLIHKMTETLDQIRNEWAKLDISEAGLRAIKFPPKDNKKSSSDKKIDLKISFIALLKDLQEEGYFINMPPYDQIDFLVEDIKTIPLNRILNHFNPRIVQGKIPSTSSAELIKELNNSKAKSDHASDQLMIWLGQIKWQKETINTKVKENLKLTITLFHAGRELQQVEETFRRFAFTDTKTLIKNLDETKIPHIFTDKSLRLDLLRNQVLAALKIKIQSDLDKEVDKLTSEAEDDLSVICLQKALRFNTLASSFLNKQMDAREQVALLRNVYLAGLDESSPDYPVKVAAWNNIERKIAGRRLSSEKLKEVLKWFIPFSHLNDKKELELEIDSARLSYEKIKEFREKLTSEKSAQELMDYLDGRKTFDLSETLRFEHKKKKIEVFQTFLEKDCFPAFPWLADKKDLLIAYFKTAYRIGNVQNNGNSFTTSFVRKIANLGAVYSRILKLEENPQSPTKEKDILLLSAEYEMQDIGELAQLITDRPALWDQGRYMLSPHHLLSISLLRKMMAHYPLLLAPHVMRWNLEYLAFDTKNHLTAGPIFSYDPQAVKTPRRKPLTSSDLREKLFYIQDHLDRLNLSIIPSVLYPSWSLPFHAFVHPFGELTLLVYPGAVKPSKLDFTHAVMELELILNYDLDAKVCVIGEWEKDLVNIPSVKYVPSSYLALAIEKKQTVHNWITSTNAYEYFQDQPWYQVIYKSGMVVPRSDYELHHDLVFFLKVLDFKMGEESLEKFLEKASLSEDVLANLTKLLSNMKCPYPESKLYRWICCLFERFCPPGTTPKFPICMPKPYGDKRALITMLDTDSNGLGLLPEKKENNLLEVTKKKLYYKGVNRLDVLNGRSLLDPSQPIKHNELNIVAKYAISVLQSHASYISEKLRPEKSLSKECFAEMESVIIADPTFGEPSRILSTVPSDIEELIKIEAKGLAKLMNDMVTTFSKQNGIDFCLHLLSWIKIEKEIEQVAREYYGKNRLRLKQPYIQMDVKSRAFFDDQYIIGNTEWRNFPFVSTFRKFLERIHLESNSLKTEFHQGELQASDDLHPNFKALIPEGDIQMALLSLMKKRRVIKQWAYQAFVLQFFHLKDLPENKFNEHFYAFHIDWNKLFRMIHSPKIFEVLKENLQKKITNLTGLQLQLQEDFKNQYKIPSAERETSTANFPTIDLKIQLLEARSYFDGINDTNQVKKQKEDFYKAIFDKPRAMFLHDWVKHFDELFTPPYFSNLIVEAREAINMLIASKEVPSHNFDGVPSYRDYWMLVNEHNCNMSISSMASGLTKSFKQLILGDITFQKLLSDPPTKVALHASKRLYKLIEAYMSFFGLENSLADLSYTLKQHADTYNRLSGEKAIIPNPKNEEWVIQAYTQRLAYTQERLKKVSIDFENTFQKIITTEFFAMLKLTVRWKHFSENKSPPTDLEQYNQALRQVLESTLFDSQDFVKALKKTGIKMTTLDMLKL